VLHQSYRRCAPPFSSTKYALIEHEPGGPIGARVQVSARRGHVGVPEGVADLDESTAEFLRNTSSS
jgi:hypothetical protein